MFASKTDIQAWLQPDKIPVNDANSEKANIEATRIVKAQLTGVFEPVVISSWDSPDNTPEMVRGVTGRLAAAFLHASIYSEESDRQVSVYAQWLYDGAMASLSQIVAGTLTVIDDTGQPIDTTGQGLLSFFPDDTTTPVFTMDQTFS